MLPHHPPAHSHSHLFDEFRFLVPWPLHPPLSCTGSSVARASLATLQSATLVPLKSLEARAILPPRATALLLLLLPFRPSRLRTGSLGQRAIPPPVIADVVLRMADRRSPPNSKQGCWHPAHSGALPSAVWAGAHRDGGAPPPIVCRPKPIQGIPRARWQPACLALRDAVQSSGVHRDER